MDGILALQKMSMTLLGAEEENSTCSICCQNSTDSNVSSTFSIVGTTTES